MKNKPPYAIESVDNALRLLQTLRDSGQVRVSDAAAELGIARSTAHRLLSMLVYRDFAVRTDDRAYLPGPALSAPPLAGEPAQRLRQLVTPHMEALRDRVSETVNLTVRLGTQTRFLQTVECDQLLRVGDRTGTILPAWHTSGGKALLADLPDLRLTELLRTVSGRPASGGPTGGPASGRLTDAERRALVAELRLIRERGYAENIEESESGVCAVGMCVRDSAGEAVAALSVSAPSVRYTPDRTRAFIQELRAALAAISVLHRRTGRYFPFISILSKYVASCSTDRNASKQAY